MSTPAADGFFMPAEWQPHTRTWMSFPVIDFMDVEESCRAWSSVANTIVDFEPVTMVVDPARRELADKWLDPRVEVLVKPLDDAWHRDNGATFLVDGKGGIAGVDWRFRAWGMTDQDWAKDDEIAAFALEHAGARRYASRMVNEGGGIHVDGEGTVIITETVQLHDRRNPGWTKEEVEAELAAMIGARKVIWLPRGLAGDYGGYGTNGHVDLLAAFVRPGLVVAHVQDDPAHPDHETSRENLALLRASTDANGRPLEVIELLAPSVKEVDGKPCDYSYINHYLANGLSLLCSFADPRDEAAAATFTKLFPARAVKFCDARPIFAYGGGIHCITQQQPRP